MKSVITDLPGVVAEETWSEADTSVIYPDGDGEASSGETSSLGDPFRTIGLPADTPMIDFPLLEDRWLRPDDENALVVPYAG